jgi:hypothetical protein
MTDRVNEWLETFDPNGLTGNAERLALDYRAELTAYLPEIRAAKTDAELSEIMAEITEITGRATSSGALAAIERQWETIERQAELAEREAEWTEQAEREAARRAEIEAGTQQKAIAGPTTRTTPTRLPGSNGYAGAAAMVIGMIEQNRRNKAMRLEKCGACDFPHHKPTPAERLYGIQTVDGWQNATGYQAPGTPAYRACSKHFADADTAITKTGFQEPARCYWELKP